MITTPVTPLEDENSPERYMGAIGETDEEYARRVREWRARQIERAKENGRRGGLAMCSGLYAWDQP